MMERPDTRDVVLGVAHSGAQAGLAAGRVALLPVRVAFRAPMLGSPLRRAAARAQWISPTRDRSCASAHG